METSQWQQNFKQWQTFADHIQARASAVINSKHDRAWKLAETVGIPRDGCCLHNAAIDTELKGWCANNPQRLKIAKLANHMMSDWYANRLAERIIRRKWKQLLG